MNRPILHGLISESDVSEWAPLCPHCILGKMHWQYHPDIRRGNWSKPTWVVRISDFVQGKELMFVVLPTQSLSGKTPVSFVMSTRSRKRRIQLFYFFRSCHKSGMSLWEIQFLGPENDTKWAIEQIQYENKNHRLSIQIYLDSNFFSTLWNWITWNYISKDPKSSVNSSGKLGMQYIPERFIKKLTTNAYKITILLPKLCVHYSSYSYY